MTKMYSLESLPETVIEDVILSGRYSFRGLSCAFFDFRASYFLSYREVKPVNKLQRAVPAPRGKTSHQLATLRSFSTVLFPLMGVFEAIFFLTQEIQSRHKHEAIVNNATVIVYQLFISLVKKMIYHKTYGARWETGDGL
jgi:hypothetical protein